MGVETKLDSGNLKFRLPTWAHLEENQMAHCIAPVRPNPCMWSITQLIEKPSMLVVVCIRQVAHHVFESD
jgi:hypothetical protein